MIAIEEDKSSLAKKITETEMPPKYHDTLILLSTEDFSLREPLLVPRTLNTNTVSTLLKLQIHNRKTIDPSTLTHIPNIHTYKQALQTFPLIQHHPKFKKLHKQVHAYFHLKTNPPHHHNGKLNISSLIEQYSISKSTIHNWINNIRRPRLLKLIENRATTLKDYQNRVALIRETTHNITTIKDLAHRLGSNHFMFAEKIQVNPQLSDHITKAKKYLAILQLVEAGYHPRDLEIHFHFYKDYIGDLLRYGHRPYLIKLAANIPTKTPPSGTKWLPTTTDQSNIPTRFISASTSITNWRQLISILNQLPRIDKPDEYLTHHLQQFGLSTRHLLQWEKEFGKITTLNDRLLLLGYLIGTSLSDGWIQQQSTLSSSFGLELSKKYKWAPTFGNRTAYFWTYLGFPVKQGEGRKINEKRPHGAYNWYSITSPFLTYFNEVILGFQPGQTHTDTPAKINWVLEAPKEFQIKVIQGLFDGDGWANRTLKEIGIHSHQNQDIIQRLLLQQGIDVIQDGDFELVIHSNQGIKAAANLPIFLSSLGRHKRAMEAAQMADAPRSSGKIYHPEVILRVLELFQQGISKNKIRKHLFQEQNLVLSNRAINRIIRDGREGILHDYLKVKAFFLLLERHIQSPSVPIYQLVRHVKEETGFSGHIDTMSGWLRKNKVPRDVKLAIAKGYHVDDSLFESYPHLRLYIVRNSN